MHFFLEDYRMLRSHRVAAMVLSVLLLVALKSEISLSICAQSPQTTSTQLIPRTKAADQAEHRISLIVQVTDASGRAVTGLKAEDFSVLDNGRPTRTASFHEFEGPAGTASVHVLVVLDAINDGGSSIGHVKKDLEKFLAQDHGPLPLPITLVLASGVGVAESQQSTDRSTVAKQLAEFARRPREAECDQPHFIEGSDINRQSMSSGSRGDPAEERADCMTTHFTESIDALRSLITAQNNFRGRKILIWTGRGWPLLADFGTQAAAIRGNYRDVLVELATNLREAQVTLDAVSWGEFERPKNARKPIVSVSASVPFTTDEIAETNMALPALVRQNGGQAVAKVKNFGDALASFLADASDFYVLTFDSTPAAAADEFREIEVKVDRADVTVRTSRSYYAQP